MGKPDFLFPREVQPNMLGPLNVQGTTTRIKHHGESLAFAKLDRNLQIVATNKDVVEAMKILTPGVIALFGGVLAERPPENVNPKEALTNHLAGVELVADDLKDVIVPEIHPDGITWESVLNSNHFNERQYLEITRMPQFQRLMAMRQGIKESFLKLFTERGYTDIQIPSLTTSVAESGAEQFIMQGQTGELSLVQSPQQIKQMLAEVYGAVVCVSSAFRNDPSTTPWHLSEFTGLDMERQVHSRDKDRALQEIMNELTDAISAIHAEILRHPQIMKDFNKKGVDAALPLLPPEGIPSFTFDQAMKIASGSHIKDWKGEWDRAAEKAVATMVRETYKSDYYYVIQFPFNEKVFYTDTVNLDDPNTLTYSFDLVCKGVEIASGGLRVNDPEKLRRQMEMKGVKPEQVAIYLQHFQRGASQTGGFGAGLDRHMALILGSTAKLMAPFPKTADKYIG